MSGPTEFDEASVSRVLDAGLTDMGLAIDAGQRARLIAYLRLLHRWNRVYNLSAVRDPVEMVRRHVHDSLTVLPFVGSGALLDAGSGAGLPGVVLAIARPDLHCVLLDRAAKKVRFLVQCVADLGLENGEPVRARIQDYRSAQRFSTIVSRAAFALADLWRTSEGLLEPEGRALVMKASRPTEAELAGLSARGAKCHVVPCRVPGFEGTRHVVVMEHGSASASSPARL